MFHARNSKLCLEPYAIESAGEANRLPQTWIGIMETYDVLVIGGGPGGYVAAIRAAQLGLRVACVDRWPAPDGKGVVYGGTCLNVGCIPSKALLESSHRFEDASAHFSDHGITVINPKIDLEKMMARKEKIVNELVGGIGMLFKKNKITALGGTAKIAKLGPPATVEIDGGATVSAKHLIIATGSVSRPIPTVPVDNDLIVDNIGGLSFPEVPKKLCIIGAGVIGLELGSVWRRLGAEVTILEALPDFLALADGDIAKAAAKEFKKQGLQINLDCMVTEAKAQEKSVRVKWEGGGSPGSGTYDRLIVAVGRMPYTKGLGARDVGLAMERDCIKVDEHCRTSAPQVWAIGDVVRGPMLAHKAEDEGVMVAELIAGQQPGIDYECIPWVIYTSPEIAWVGKTEQQLAAAGVPYAKGSFPFAANGRAKGIGNTTGMVKILAHKETDRVLGVHIFGINASDMIGEAVLAMEFGAAAEDIARTCHAHPTLSEAVKEAALAVDNRAIHS